MTDSLNEARPQAQPPLPELLARYLQRQQTARTDGLAMAEPTGAVLPFEAPAQPVEPRLAWKEALTALRCFQPEAAKQIEKPPSDWAGLVAAQEPLAAVAFAVGSYPQLVRSLRPLLEAPQLCRVRSGPGAPLVVAPGAEHSLPQRLIRLGLLRLARRFDAALELVHSTSVVPSEWRNAWENELAALEWHRGDGEQAAAHWDALADSAPVLFNRGMAALFLDQPAKARPALAAAARLLPDDSGWHHLAHLYLALAESR